LAIFVLWENRDLLVHFCSYGLEILHKCSCTNCIQIWVPDFWFFASFVIYVVWKMKILAFSGKFSFSVDNCRTKALIKNLVPRFIAIMMGQKLGKFQLSGFNIRGLDLFSRLPIFSTI
jgi:hypothetical protein